MTHPTQPTQPTQPEPAAGSRYHLPDDPTGAEHAVLVLGRAPGPQLHLLDVGATVHRLRVTGGDGERRDVALSHPTLAERRRGDAYLGATIGRYANRIAGARFELDGREVLLGAVDRGHSLHGGPEGFDRARWQVLEHGTHHAVLTLHSPEGDQGFPGAVDVQARFEVDDAALALTLTATSTADTVLNLTQHVYLTLAGAGAGTVDDHVLTVPASRWVEVDATGIPAEGPLPVPAEADLRAGERLGDVVRRGHPQVIDAHGIDHTYVLDAEPDGDGLREHARLADPASRTVLTLRSDQAGVQVYTGNFLDGTLHGLAPDGGTTLLRQGDGLCLEPGAFPDSPHHLGEPGWTDVRLAAGESYAWRARWEFAALD
ncbi:aldose epimerase family protein [Nocardioides sp. GY 10127]|uniref:aldose epimerase family protein n=1 Tax=Nocardioides sp. GY 10127 TaxID=2569762 RepID=UPI001457F942|nr:aldose epimerase family protein [Nocardioides sp. GY 10127]